MNGNLLTRNDTILGICEGIGEDFGFNPLWLRLAFIAPLFWFPAQMVGLYLALGLVVLTSRRVFPAPRKEKPDAMDRLPAGEPAPQPVTDEQISKAA